MQQSAVQQHTVVYKEQREDVTTNLNELQIFSLVAQTRSFTKAAEQLIMPKSSVSRAISRLEQRLTVQLVQRTTRSVRLTEMGKLYFLHCQRVIEAAEQADIAIGAMMAVPKGTLRIGVPVAFARFILEPLLNEFLLLYPELNIDIELLNSQERQSDERFDLVVRMGPLEDSGWLVKPLMQVRLGLYASPALCKQHQRPASPMDLQRYPCIASNCVPLSEPGGHIVWRLRHGREVQEVRVTARVAVPDPSVHRQLALKGVAVSMLSQAEVAEDLKMRRLLRLLPKWEPEPIALCALYPSRLTASPKVRALIEFLEKSFADRS